MSQATGTGNVLAPPELVELGLMEKFHWTPEQIDRIPFGKLQRIFVVMNQKEQSQIAANEVKSQMISARKSSKSPKGSR